MLQIPSDPGELSLPGLAPQVDLSYITTLMADLLKGEAPIFLVAGAPSCQGKTTILTRLLQAAPWGKYEAFSDQDKIVPLFRRWLRAQGPTCNIPIAEFRQQLQEHEPQFASRAECSQWLKQFDGIVHGDAEAILASLKATKQRCTLESLLRLRANIVLDSRTTTPAAIADLTSLAQRAGYRTVLFSVTVNDEATYFARWYARNLQKKRGQGYLERLYREIAAFQTNWPLFTAMFEQAFLVGNDDSVTLISAYQCGDPPTIYDVKGWNGFLQKKHQFDVQRRLAQLSPAERELLTKQGADPVAEE